MPDEFNPRNVGESGFSNDATNIGAAGWESMMSRLSGVVGPAAQKQGPAQTASAVSPVVNQLDNIVQRQSAVATLLSAGLAKQTSGPGLLSTIGGAGALLGTGYGALAFAGNMTTPGRSGVGGNVESWRQMQTEAGEQMRPGARIEGVLRNYFDPTPSPIPKPGGGWNLPNDRGAKGGDAIDIFGAAASAIKSGVRWAGDKIGDWATAPGQSAGGGDPTGALNGPKGNGRVFQGGGDPTGALPRSRHSASNWLWGGDFGGTALGQALFGEENKANNPAFGPQQSGDTSDQPSADYPRPGSHSVPGAFPGEHGYKNIHPPTAPANALSEMQSAMDKLRNGTGAVSFGSKQV